MADLVAGYEAALPEGGWPNWVLGNHDQPRIAARVGEPQARVAAMLLLTLRGTPTLYYGDEIGIGRIVVPPERARDPWEANEPGHGRDPQRTPMHWDDGAHAGFSAAEPWLPLSDDWVARNVEAQACDPGSMLTLHRRLLALRRDHDALSVGGYRGVASGVEDVFAYERFSEAETLRIVLNFGAQAHALPLPAGAWRVLLSTRPGRAGEAARDALALGGDEGVILART